MPARRRHNVRPSAHLPRLDFDEPADPYAPERALAFAGQALNQGYPEEAAMWLKLADSFLRTTQRLIAMDPDVFDWVEDMHEEERAEAAEAYERLQADLQP